MKTWTLIWLLVYPPSDDGLLGWHSSREHNLTQTECHALLDEKEAEWVGQLAAGEIVGYEIYCKEYG